jgi:hypothetical protein
MTYFCSNSDKYTKPGWGISAFIIAFLMTYFCSNTQNQVGLSNLHLITFEFIQKTCLDLWNRILVIHFQRSMDSSLKK